MVIDGQKRKLVRELTTTDVELYTESLKEKQRDDSFIEAMNETTIECQLTENAKCRICLPNNAALFIDDYMVDMKMGDPCKLEQQKTVQVEEVLIDGVQYYFTATSENIRGYHVYEYDSSLNAYKPLDESTELYNLIVDKISKN